MTRFLLRRLAAALSGYVAIVLATSAGFAPLGGIIHITAPLRVHALATAIAIASGILGGMVAGWVGGRASAGDAFGTAACVAIESAFVIGFQSSSDPLWFDLFGAATLIGATIAGGLLWSLVSRHRRLRPAANRSAVG